MADGGLLDMHAYQGWILKFLKEGAYALASWLGWCVEGIKKKQLKCCNMANHKQEK